MYPLSDGMEHHPRLSNSNDHPPAALNLIITRRPILVTEKKRSIRTKTIVFLPQIYLNNEDFKVSTDIIA